MTATKDKIEHNGMSKNEKCFCEHDVRKSKTINFAPIHFFNTSPISNTAPKIASINKVTEDAKACFLDDLLT